MTVDRISLCDGLFGAALALLALMVTWDAHAQEPRGEVQAVPMVAPFPSICNYCIQMDQIGIKLKAGGMTVVTRAALSTSGGAFFQTGPGGSFPDGECAVYGTSLSIEAASEKFPFASTVAHLSAVAQLKAGGEQKFCQTLELWPISSADASWEKAVTVDRVCKGSVVQLPTLLFVDPSNGLRMLGGLRGDVRRQLHWSPNRQLPPYPVQNVCDGKLVSIDEAVKSFP